MRKQLVCVLLVFLGVLTASLFVASDGGATNQPGGGTTCCECSLPNGGPGCSCSIGPCSCQAVQKTDGTTYCNCSCGAAKQI